MARRSTHVTRGRRGGKTFAADAVRAKLQQLLDPACTPTDTILDEISKCPDATKASKLLADAIAADNRADAGGTILPPPAWILPP